MDQAVRNTLRNTVTRCRKLLEESTAQALQGQFGIFAVGRKNEVQIEDDAQMGHLSVEDRACRQDLIDHYEHIRSLGYKDRAALEQLIREIAFTHLNRLCAYKMMEARGLIRDAVGRGLKSQGFFFYLADHPEAEKLHASGQQEAAYRQFLDWLGGTLSEEIGVLFNPNDPANRVYPPHRVLDDVLALINDESLAAIWDQDETIGWVYQYFTPKELRDKARKESSAPRNSYELAFRNQFFTPRYVVEFLTDNTLGRIWYEMRQGGTALTDRCQYLVRRPNEVFLAKGQEPPDKAGEDAEDPSQEELLRQPVYIPFRPKKDPRELRVLDPACGSGHFLLYCFDLLQVIYQEAYDDPDLGAALRKDFPSLDDLRTAVPGLILRHNLHGIDIDFRATQIAALALWLRCQRAYQELGLQNAQRPRISRSNVVCAEPMPGDTGMLREFASELQPRVLGQLVEEVFEKMHLAGEAGSLLKIEEDIRVAANKAKDEYVRWKKQQAASAEFLLKEYAPQAEPDLLDFADLGDERFLDRAEEEIVGTLRRYAEHAADGSSYRRRLFAEDAGRGFAFVDISRQEYDVVLMNPPFGEATSGARAYLYQAVPSASQDLFAAFVERYEERLSHGGRLGAITNRLAFFKDLLATWRRSLLLGGKSRLSVAADLGYGVLDAAVVEAAAYVIERGSACDLSTPFFGMLETPNKDSNLRRSIQDTANGVHSHDTFEHQMTAFTAVPGDMLAYWCSERWLKRFADCPTAADLGVIAKKGLETGDDFRYLRLLWEVPTDQISPFSRWTPFSKGGEYRPWLEDLHLAFDWRFKMLARRTSNSELYGLPGLTYTERTTSNYAARVLPAQSLFSPAGPIVVAPSGWPELSLLGWLNSSVVAFYIELLVGGGDSSESGTAARHFSPAMIEGIPIPSGFSTHLKPLTESMTRLHAALGACQMDETAAQYAGHKPRGDGIRASAIARFEQMETQSLAALDLFRLVDEHVFEAYSLSDDEREDLKRYLGRPQSTSESTPSKTSLAEFVKKLFGPSWSSLKQNPRIGIECPARAVKKLCFIADDRLETASAILGISPKVIARERRSLNLVPPGSVQREACDVVSYCLGCRYGRWDVRLTDADNCMREATDPFLPLPACPPGMLQGIDGLPAKPEEVPGDYPVRIDWDGILVDDPDHGDDIVRCVRDVIGVIWGDQTETIEVEICEVLGVRTLRDYFRKPSNGGFWVDHVKRYSKSRRKAPIYWYLRSAKGNYGLWLYYHRLDKDTYFKCLVNYVEPKLRMEENRLQTLRTGKAAIGSAGREAKRLEKDIDRQEQFVAELHDFRDKLRRVADLHLSPDLNDGVILNIAPLHELVPWKEAEKCRERLQAGEYDWSHIAYQLWPDRVKELCRTDLSVAIAHGLEDLCEVEIPDKLRNLDSGDGEDDEEDDTDNEEEAE